MAKSATQRIGVGAFEGALHSIMPQLIERLDRIQLDVRQVDAKVDQLRQEMYDKFEQSRDLSNELGQRIARMEGKLDAFTAAVHRQSSKMDEWIERLVRVEMTRPARRRKAS
jgi:ABC-type phosphate transport system auxiliary subunit